MGTLLFVGALGTADGAHAGVPNLIQNAYAEDGGGGSATGFPPPSWTTSTGFVAERYGAEYRPSTAAGGFGGGSYAFAGGSDQNVSSASQIIDIGSEAVAIDRGHMLAQLLGYLGGIDDEGDYAEVSVDYERSTSGTPTFVKLEKIGPVTAADRGNQTKFLSRGATAVVPAGTRRLRVTITATRLYGTYTDGYADNLILTLRRDPASATVSGIKRKGKKVTGKVAAAAPCKSGRKVVLSKRSKTIASAKSKSSGKFTLKSKKAKTGKLKVTVKKRTVGKTTCLPVAKKV